MYYSSLEESQPNQLKREHLERSYRRKTPKFHPNISLSYGTRENVGKTSRGGSRLWVRFQNPKPMVRQGQIPWENIIKPIFDSVRFYLVPCDFQMTQG